MQRCSTILLLTAAAACLSCSGTARATDIPVGAGDQLQDALDAAQPGDTIILEPGAVFRGNFVLPAKAGADWITITTSGAAALPPPGSRVAPALARLMPKIISPNNGYALAAARGAHHYRITGIELGVTSGVHTLGVVALGFGNEKERADLPHHIELDRVYIHGDPGVGGKRGVALNSGTARITNSYISDIRSADQDAQAICGWNGTGPYEILNNYLEASGEVIMFGGAPRAIPDAIPSDILIRHNHITRPLAWRNAVAPSGGPWAVKNLVELKCGRRVAIEENLIENTWTSAQVGYAFVLKAEGADTPPPVTEDVLIAGNIVRNAAGAVNIAGHIKDGPGGQAKNITIRNNLFENIGRDWGAEVGLFMILNAAEGVVIEHNTATPTVDPYMLMSLDVNPSPGLIFRSNIVPKGIYGVKGSGYSAFGYYLPGCIFTNNVIFNAGEPPPEGYPEGNFFVGSAGDVGWSRGVVQLGAGSPYSARAHDGTDPGVDPRSPLWSDPRMGGRPVTPLVPGGRKR